MKIYHGKVTAVQSPLPRPKEDQKRYVEFSFMIEEAPEAWATIYHSVRVRDDENEFQLGDSVSITIAKVM